LLWHVSWQGAAHAFPNPAAGSRASRDSRARTVVALSSTQTSWRCVARAAHRIRVPADQSVGPKRPGPGQQLPTGAWEGLTGGLLHEHAHPERGGL